MKITDIDEVNKLVKIGKRCRNALYQLGEFDSTQTEPDSGGVPGFELGYHGYLTRFDDGSGTSVDMGGCYVGIQLAAATRVILEKQIVGVENRLHELGVTED